MCILAGGRGGSCLCGAAAGCRLQAVDSLLQLASVIASCTCLEHVRPPLFLLTFTLVQALVLDVKGILGAAADVPALLARMITPPEPKALQQGAHIRAACGVVCGWTSGACRRARPATRCRQGAMFECCRLNVAALDCVTSFQQSVCVHIEIGVQLAALPSIPVCSPDLPAADWCPGLGHRCSHIAGPAPDPYALRPAHRWAVALFRQARIRFSLLQLLCMGRMFSLRQHIAACAALCTLPELPLHCACCKMLLYGALLRPGSCADSFSPHSSQLPPLVCRQDATLRRPAALAGPG